MAYSIETANAFNLLGGDESGDWTDVKTKKKRGKKKQNAAAAAAESGSLAASKDNKTVTAEQQARALGGGAADLRKEEEMNEDNDGFTETGKKSSKRNQNEASAATAAQKSSQEGRKAALGTAEKYKMRTATRLCRGFPCDFANAENVQSADVDNIVQELGGVLTSDASLTEVMNVLGVLLGDLKLSVQIREILEDLLPLIGMKQQTQFAKAACDAFLSVMKFVFSELYHQRKPAGKQEKNPVKKESIAEKLAAISELKARRTGNLQDIDQKKKLQDLLELQIAVVSRILGKNLQSTKGVESHIAIDARNAATMLVNGLSKSLGRSQGTVSSAEEPQQREMIDQLERQLMSLNHQIKDVEARLSNLLSQKQQVEQRISSYKQSVAITTMAVQQHNGVGMESQDLEKYVNAARKLESLSSDGLKLASTESKAVETEGEDVNALGGDLLETLLAVLSFKREHMVLQKNRIIFCLSKLEVAKNDEADHLRMGYEDLAAQASKNMKKLLDMRKGILKQAKELFDYSEVAEKQADFFQNELPAAPLSGVYAEIMEMINSIRGEYTTILKFNSGELVPTAEDAKATQQIATQRDASSNPQPKNPRSKTTVMSSTARPSNAPLRDNGPRHSMLPQQGTTPWDAQRGSVALASKSNSVSGGLAHDGPAAMPPSIASVPPNGDFSLFSNPPTSRSNAASSAKQGRPRR